MIIDAERLMPVSEPVATLADYLAIGGGEGLARAREHGPEWVIDAVTASGLRGRAGAGVPTARKWTAERTAAFVVGTAEDGEPGTAKDRYLLGRNPYQVVEGLAIAALTLGVRGSFIVIRREFECEIGRLCAALDEMRDADLLGPVPVRLILGPDDLPLGRLVLHNVETLAHIPEILRLGPAWFRSNETMVFTVSGDVCRPGVFELPIGISLRLLVELCAGGAGDGRRVRAVLPGAGGAALTDLDISLDFASMPLGAGGFVVHAEPAVSNRVG